MCRERIWPEGRPWPEMMLNTPGGKSASSASSAMRATARGAFSLDLSTTVLPVMSAGADLVARKWHGTFQGMMTATTPYGWRRVMVTIPGVLTLAWP